MRAVVDTNVLLSILLHGSSHPLLLALHDQRFRLISSRTLRNELTSVLCRPKWRHLADTDWARQMADIVDEAAMLVDSTERLTVCRDPTDNAVLECAVAGRAACIVTGDRDLLVLDPFRGMRILRPTDFLRALR